MVAVKRKIQFLPDGSVDFPAWLQAVSEHRSLKNTEILHSAYELAHSFSQGLTTFYGEPYIAQGLEMAEILLDLNLDQDSLAAAILATTTQQTRLSIETISEKLSPAIAQLVAGFLQMNAINVLASLGKDRDNTQLDRLRKILLAMVSDIRVVLIKLAERTAIMRGIKKINPIERKHIAEETMDIFAPLANRLGIGQLKWELEDLSFHYIDPDTYKKIADFLAERREDRLNRIHNIISTVKETLLKKNIKAHITGRAKHIYSIYLKMRKKDLDLKNIFDYSAIRILVPTLDDCYTTLSVIHQLWEHVEKEFDDYISKPKPNGYSSIHTAVIDSDGKHFEIQIRTHDMHERAEHGVAAHWLYKENKVHHSGYEAKISYLRQLLAWQKDVSIQEEKTDSKQATFLDDRVYIFTPAGDILDLPVGSTPLDFAYHVHTSLGHRCRGAKVNGHIVPLTHTLQTGDQVDIITIKEGAPSRDWLNMELGYLATSRARGKVAHWFKQQDVHDYVESGKEHLEKEFARAGIHQMNLQKIAARLNYKKEEDFFAAIGRGSLRITQIFQLIHAEQKSSAHHATSTEKKLHPIAPSLNIAGTEDLLTRVARCCKPIPGDAIVGFITQGRGVSIHRRDCNNLRHLSPLNQGRMIEVAWDSQKLGSYYVDLQIRATTGHRNLLKDIPGLVASLKMELVSLHSTISKKNNMVYITLTIQIHELTQLKQLTTQLHQLSNVLDVRRISSR